MNFVRTKGYGWVICKISTSVLFSMWLGVLNQGFRGIFEASGIQADLELIFWIVFQSKT